MSIDNSLSDQLSTLSLSSTPTNYFTNPGEF